MQNIIPKVSVCVPVYNAAKFIERCARSLFEQTYENLEFLFVDDCSSDNSVSLLYNVIDENPSRKSTVKVIRHETNKGVSVARNTLLTNVSGDFFTFVDADDRISQDAVELLVSKQLETNADLVSGNMILEYDNDNSLIEEPLYNNAYEMLTHIVGQQGHHENVGRLFRTKIVRDNKLVYAHGINIGEDWLFLVKFVMFVSKIASIPQVVYYYDRRNTQSAMHNLMSERNIQKWYLADLIVLDEIKKVVSKRVQMDFSSLENMILIKGDKGLREAATKSDRETFYAIKAKVLPYLDQCKDAIVGKYNRYSICRNPNYYLCKFYVSVLNLKYRQ